MSSSRPRDHHGVSFTEQRVYCGGRVCKSQGKKPFDNLRLPGWSAVIIDTMTQDFAHACTWWENLLYYFVTRRRFRQHIVD